MIRRLILSLLFTLLTCIECTAGPENILAANKVGTILDSIAFLGYLDSIADSPQPLKPQFLGLVKSKGLLSNSEKWPFVTGEIDVLKRISGDQQFRKLEFNIPVKDSIRMGGEDGKPYSVFYSLEPVVGYFVFSKDPGAFLGQFPEKTFRLCDAFIPDIEAGLNFLNFKAPLGQSEGANHQDGLLGAISLLRRLKDNSGSLDIGEIFTKSEGALLSVKMVLVAQFGGQDGKERVTKWMEAQIANAKISDDRMEAIAVAALALAKKSILSEADYDKLAEGMRRASARHSGFQKTISLIGS